MAKIDMTSVMNKAHDMGFTFKTTDVPNKPYKTELIFNGVVEGYIMVKNGGIAWDYPQRVIDALKAS